MTLFERPDAPPRPPRTTGLFHLALLVPDRAELAADDRFQVLRRFRGILLDRRRAAREEVERVDAAVDADLVVKPFDVEAPTSPRATPTLAFALSRRVISPPISRLSASENTGARKVSRLTKRVAKLQK